MSDAVVEASGQAAESSGDADERLAYRGLGQRMLLRPEIVGVLFALLLYVTFWAVTRPFGNAGGIATVLDVSATLGIMAVAVGALMIGGEFDLSSGAMTGTMGIIIVLLVKDIGERGGAGLSYWIAIPLSLLIALGLGWINGTLVVRTGLPSFIVTLATFFVLRGVKLGGSKLMVDQIQVGRADEGAHYGFWHNIFGASWVRGDHVWEGRDAAYTVLLIIGGIILASAIYEFAFERKESTDPKGLAMFGAGVAGVVAGVILMHTTDGNDWLPAVVIAAAATVAGYGLAQWRYIRHNEAAGFSLPGPIVRNLVASIACLGLAVVAALAFDPYNEESLVFPVTHQGARAILFVALCAAAAVFAGLAVYKARSVSAKAKSAALFYAAIATFVIALFVQSESVSRKLRAELFSVLLLIALFIFIWAVVSLVFKVRTHVDAAADQTARRTALVGGLLIAAGLIIRLLFAVEAEILAEDSARLAKFSVRILWFIAFTGVISWVLRSTKFGSWTYAVGGNKDAARQIGVPADRTKVQLFMLVAAAAWLVGILLAFRLNTIQAGTGNFEEFEYIIAAVVGGTFLTGGYGSALGAAMGALIMAMAQQGISFAGWNTDWRFLFLGMILLVAVYQNGFVRRTAESLR